MQRLKSEMDDSEFVILAVNVGEDEDTVFGFTFSLPEIAATLASLRL